METNKDPSGGVIVLRRVIGGTVGGVLQAACSHPFDTIKSRVQQRQAASILKCVAATWKNEGLVGFYRGVTPPLFMLGLYNALLFGLNGWMNVLVTPRNQKPGTPLSVPRIALAAELTAPLYVLALTPMEVIKVRLQVQPQEIGKKLYTGPFNCLFKTVKAEGIRAIFRGYLPTLGSRIVGLPFYFGVYELAKRQLTDRFFNHSVSHSGQQQPPENVKNDTAKLPAWVPMSSGIFAGFGFWFSNYPLDYVKTQCQASSTATPIGVVRRTIAAEGIGGFYKGFSAALVRSAPANASIWYGIEFTTNFMENHGW